MKSKQTPYAVLAKLVDELNEENEILTRQNKQLKQEMVEFMKGRDEFRKLFSKIASEMSRLLAEDLTRKLAVSSIGERNVIYL